MTQVIVPTKEQWEVLRELGLNAPEQGMTIISPLVARYMRLKGRAVEHGEEVDYDFGGEPDVWLDVVTDDKHLFVKRLLLHEEEDAEEFDYDNYYAGLEDNDSKYLPEE